MKNRKLLKWILIPLAALLLLVGIGYGGYALFFDPHRGTLEHFEESLPLESTLTKAQATQDLKALHTYVSERHPAWLDGSTELVDAFEKQYNTELAALSDSLTVFDLAQAAGRITAVLHDGHTWAQWYTNDGHLYINDATQLMELDYPVAINGEPVEEVLKRYKAVFSNETEAYAERNFYDVVLWNRQKLALCDVDVSNGVEMSYVVDEAGNTQTFHYTYVPFEQVTGMTESVANQMEVPFVEYELHPQDDAAVFTLRSCDFTDEYRATVKAFFEEVAQAGIQNVIVDLRGNGGGNSNVGTEFIRYLPVDEYAGWDSAIRFGSILYKNENVRRFNEKLEPQFTGKVYVLMNVHTYSAAMDFAMLIGDNDLGTLVGEPSGNMPRGYGDALDFMLPNSKLAVSVSFKKWERVDKSLSDRPLEPDIPVESGDMLQQTIELIAQGK